MMQSLHHQQQQLAALLSVALPKDDSTSSATASDDDSSRLAALNSLHRAILYPPNSVLVTHSATFLAQGFSQLLTDISYAVRQSAVVAYGALCAVVCSIPISSNGRQNHVLLGSLVDRFIGWALPLLSNAGAADGTKELALEGLREFLSVGDVVGTERYALPILKACQVLLEDERTSLNLLPRILGVLNLISLKFMRCFQPHFVDIVDLLLGWALVPDLTESDRRIIMDSFLQFQKYWVGNLQISLGLLSKFLGDMDVLLQDGSPGTPQQFHRLLALLSCFCTILQSTASGLLEMNLLEQISEPLGRMLPSLLACVSLIGQKFGWSEWIGDSWKCLTLLAEILRERFSTFYPLAVDVLFRSLEVGNSSIPECVGKITSFQVHGVLKTNLQLLSLQKQGLLPSCVRKLLYFHSPISQLRLHPNHLVTGGSAATYVFLLQHGNDEVVNEALALLMEELESLKDLVGKFSGHEDEATNNLASKAISKPELFALMKFDLKVLLACVVMAADGKSMKRSDIANVNLRRSEKLVSFVTKNLDPFNIPIQAYVELQVNIIKTLDRLAQIEYLTKCSIDQNHCSSNYAARKESVCSYSNLGRSMVIIELLDKYSMILGKALHDTASLAVKLAAFDWLHKFCENVIAGDDFSDTAIDSYESFGYVGVVMNLVGSVLGATYDREPDVRSRAAIILEKLLQAKIVHPIYFYPIADVILEKLGDPDIEIKNAYVRLLADLLSTTVYACGLSELENSKPGTFRLGNSSSFHWRQIFALKQLPQQLQSKQLVSILSYISRRWKAPLSSWIQRLICNCKTSKDSIVSQSEDSRNLVVNVEWTDTKVDEDILEKSCSVNNLAGAWWAVQEAARYCISSRLRTNLGGPTQTFAALERMLLDIAHILQLDSEQNEGNLSMIGSSGAHLLPMRLLLEFVEALKKNVYNAYEGSVILPSVTRQSSLFFRANRKVCEEWFSRICEPMMNAGLALHCNDATIQYCMLRLQEVKNLVGLSLKDKPRNQIAENIQNTRERYMGDFLKIVQHISLALCKSYEPAALIGLQRWISMTFSSLLVDENQSFVGSGSIGLISWITGLVYQAKGEYENAAAHFTHMLQNEEALSSLGSDGVQFVIARVIECYTAVSDWKSLESWLLELQTVRSKHAGKSYSGALTTAGNEINAIHALAHFDDGDYQAAWACLDLTPKSSGELTLDPKLALHRSEQMLLQALLLSKDGKSDKIPNELQKARCMLEEMLSVLPLDGLTEAAPYAIQLHCIHTLEEKFKFKTIHDKPQQLPSMLNSYVLSVLSPMSGIVQDCKPWLNVLRVYQNEFAASPVTLRLGLNLLNLARKQSNLLLANRLNSYVRDHTIICSDERHRDILISNLQYESILLQYAENKFEDAFSNLWSFVLPCMVSEESKLSDVADRILKAKACLKLSDWLRRKYSDWNPNNLVPKLLAKLDLDENSSLGKNSENNLSSETKFGLIIEEIVGTFTKLSTRICPTMGKSWISYAEWCFQQAKDTLFNRGENVLESCSFSPVLGAEVIPDRYRLTEDEMKRIESLVLLVLGNRVDPKSSRDEGEEGSSFFDDANSKIGNSLQALVMQVVNIIETVSGSPSAEKSGSGSLSTLLSSQLKSCLSYANAIQEDSVFSSTLDGLVDIWWSLRRRKVSLFGHAAHGYIQYLSCSSQRLYHGEMTGSDSEFKKKKSGSYTLRAILYVLHILLNYGVELKDTLEPSLSMVTLLPWQEVIPQLFARLSSHPEEGIRKQLEALLIMLAKQSPWSVVYPTLVDVNAYEENPSEELQNVLGCLKELYPRLVQDVQLMIIELGNVTVLWEELWLSTLQDLHTDVMRRINVLREEAARISDNVTLSQSEKNKINAARYSAMMAPIVVALERRLASTSRKPETSHEVWFQAEYGEQLKSAILSFKTPPASAAAVGDVWRPFDSIAASLASYQRKSSISLKEVAPQLALLSSSDVPMPGLEKSVKISESDSSLASNLRGIVTIASFSEQVIILSTKTKPKKLCILGSDGKEYTYLLKGREDLRLDARIMQLLQAINGFLRSSPSTYHNSPHIRYYSVTPISGRAGLIQWVDNVVSIYSIFKAWQSRAQLAQLATTGSGNTKGSAPPPVPRPSDMFYGKIIPALKEKGIRRVISRRDWPHEVKRKVLVDLMKEVPRQLLYQELWCASVGYKAFSLKQKRYSGSVAAMSIVGHILGLGDRHLDNILIDFCSGDIVHIDYNVSFDKGQRLKIPEIVPFRLTQMIEAALGLTGVEGSFRANCEAVAGVLRKNKDIILMLLEVFVWDPLIEWTRGDFHDDAAIGGEERKGMELAVSLSLFASRVQEIRVPLQEHHDLLLTTLPAVESALERFAEVLVQYELASALFYRADQERSNLILHETSAKSIVTEATSTLEKIRASFEIQAREFSQAKALVLEKAREATTWIEQHGRILDALRNSLIPEVYNCTKLSDLGEALSLTSSVTGAGVPLTVVPEPTQVQCYDIDREVSQLMAELDDVLASATTAIQAYSFALQRILPLNYLTTSAMHSWAQVLQLAASAVSSDVVSLARRQASELFSKFHVDHVDSTRCVHDDLCMKAEKYALDIEKFEEECKVLEDSVGLEAETKAKDRILSVFVKYLQSSGLISQESILFSSQSGQTASELQEKNEKALSVLNMALSKLFNKVKDKMLHICSDPTVGSFQYNSSTNDFGTIFYGFEEEIEKCNLLIEVVNELRKFIGKDFPGLDVSKDHQERYHESNWVSIFKSSLLSSKVLAWQMTEVVIPEVLKSTISLNSDVRDTYKFISQIRGSIYNALEQLVEVELERASLNDLEKSYFLKVGQITEQQLALEEAAVKGRDHLSWEEAEELASQEEACREQLDQLHQTWNQRDAQASSLIKRETDIKNTLVSLELQFQSVVNGEEEVPNLGSSALLALLVSPFSELESLDSKLSSSGYSVEIPSTEISAVADLINSGHPLSDYVWKVGGFLNSHSFFIWKITVMDSLLDSCINDMASSVEQSLGFDHLLNVVKKKLEYLLQKCISQYLNGRVVPSFLVWLDKDNENLKQTEAKHELFTDQMKMDEAVRRFVLMLEEYCNAHETARAANSAANLMRRQVNELKEALRKTSLEVVQMEWTHGGSLNLSHGSRIRCERFLDKDDRVYSLILDSSRSNILENIQTAVSKITRSLDCLQSCVLSSARAEEQLDRAMVWACGGPNSGASAIVSSKSSGIPPEFHDHIKKRREVLCEAREKASEIVNLSISILEFEASRDGILLISGDPYTYGATVDSKTWQQSYLNALTRLDVTYHSYARAEQEWKLAQSTKEAASNGLYTATNELCIASLKAKSASGDLQKAVLSMRDCAYEADVALSGFGRVSRTHTSLTSECGSMLEEVLAVTEDLHDVHGLAKEAAAVHLSLVQELSKANSILLPLEAVLSKDVTAMTNTISMERETKMEVSHIHGQAIYQSYCLRIREAYQNFKPLVPSLTSTVKTLYSMLTRLARTASLHAGNLHKALEGIGESQEVKSEDVSMSRSEPSGDATQFDDKDKANASSSDDGDAEDFPDLTGVSLQEKGWLSPPDSVCSTSSGSGLTSAEASIPDNFKDPAESMEQDLLGSGSIQVTDHVDSSFSRMNLEENSDSRLSDSGLLDVEANDFASTALETNENSETAIKASTESLTVSGDALNSVNENSASLDGKEVNVSFYKVKSDDQHEEPVATTYAGRRVGTGKNAYALSVLRRVEMKIDGRDIYENREVEIAEQVDYLLKQATSLDNLCNMYEGWTPWI